MKKIYHGYGLTVSLLFILLLPALYGGCGSTDEGGPSPSINVLGNIPKGEKIFFIRDYFSIYVMQPDGSSVTPIIQSSFFISGITPSPQGDKLVFGMHDPDINSPDWTSNNLHIWLLEGGRVRQLTFGSVMDEVSDWSSDGRTLYFSRNFLTKGNNRTILNPSGIWKLNLDTREETQLSSPSTAREDGSPCVSPDGKRVAFSNLTSIGNGYIAKDIDIMDADGSNRHLFIEKGNFCSWSPDGERIAFIRQDGEPPEDMNSLFFDGINYYYLDGNIYTAAADGTDIKKVTKNGWVWAGGSWSPDGTKILYSKEVDHLDGPTTFEIWTVNADGTNPVRLTSGHSDLPAFWSR